MNLKKFLRFFVVQSLVFLTNFRYVQAFSFPENIEPLVTIPFEASEQSATVPLMTLTGANDFFVSQNLEIKLEGLLSKMETLLSPLAFSLLLFLMLAYWSQAAFFGQEKYKAFNNFIFFLAIASLTLLLSFRWIISKHFPLSNLYESLVFLSLCFLSLKAFFLPTTKLSQKTNATSLKPALENQIFNDLGQPLQNDVLYQSHADQNQNPEISLQIEESADPFGGTKSSYKSSICTCTRTYEGVGPNFSSNLAREKKADFLALSLGVILSPLSLLTFGFAFLSLPKEMQHSTALVPALQSNWLMMHVTVMILSYAALISGSILAIAFVILSYFQSSSTVDDSIFFDKVNLEQNIKSRVETLGTKLEYSSLTIRLDNYSYRILALGFPLLTIGILSGAVWANEAWGSYWSWDPKETWALITWLVFAIYLHTRITKGWSGKKPAIVASAGFFMVWFCYLGVNLLGTGLHSYGWFTKTFTG